MKTAVCFGIAVLVAAASVVTVGVIQTRKIADDLISDLNTNTRAPSRKVRFDELSSLPRPVEQYLRSVLTDGQGRIIKGTFAQSGQLRTALESDRWLEFTATQHAAPMAPGFVWDAKVKIWGPLHVRVLDSYIRGTGSGLVRLLSTLTVGEDRNTPELNSGALHRYLAEAVWYPTALLPESGVHWSPIDNRRALATIKAGEEAVSLEFRFNEAGEVTGIYSPGRWGSFDGEYKQVAWEGRFERYQAVQGMRVPSRGEVGWYSKGELAIVWRGEVLKAEYQLAD